ncbi:2405_t:CDS:1, partial [Racocetra fulgida]
MFSRKNRFKKSIPQQSYDLNIRSKKTYLSDYTFSNDLKHNNINLQTSYALFSNEFSNSSSIDNQQFKYNSNQINDGQQSYHGNISQDYNDQYMSNSSVYDSTESNQEFEDNWSYDDRE